MKKVIKSNKFYCRVGTIKHKYWGARKIITIQTINNFIVHRLFNSYIKVILNTFCYHINNNWKKLVDQEDEKITVIIVTPILTTICMQIGLIRFLEERFFEIKYNADGTICKKCSGLNWRNNYKEEVAKKAINKDDNNETSKQKARQIREEKQRVTCNAKMEEIWQ